MISQFEINVLEFLHRVSRKLKLQSNPENNQRFLELNSTGQDASDYIRQKMEAGLPLMVTRFGVGELNTVLRFKKLQQKFSLFSFLSNKTEPHWWTDDIKMGMYNNAGFFPPTDENLGKFASLMLDDIKLIDILGCWQANEYYLKDELKNAYKVKLEDLEPYYHADPWSASLKQKTVLVIHPFESSIVSQFLKSDLLFPNRNVLPRFKIKTLKAVQSLAQNNVEFNTWFDALNDMKSKIDHINFDIALIGCGAYGLPLAAHVKRMGKQAIHLGGATQILFGIKGRRWESIPYFRDFLFNEHWVKPLPEETPTNSENVEGACYW